MRYIRYCRTCIMPEDDFIAFLGLKPRQFWEIVEKFWNQEIFEEIDDLWRLKNPLWKLENQEGNVSLPVFVDRKEV